MAQPEPVNSPEELGRAIRDRRKEAGLTQKTAASLAGVGARFLSELERGKSTSEIGKTLRVLQILGLELFVSTRA